MRKKLKKKTKITLKFYFFFSVILGVAILTPHIVHGHVLIPKQYAQSVVLILDATVAYFFYRLYRREMQKANQEKEAVIQAKEKTEKQLLDTYKYLGKNNNTMDLMRKFIDFFPSDFHKETIKEKDIFSTLLANMLVSVAQTKQGLIRFIDKKSTNTIDEYYYHLENKSFSPKLSNAKIIKGDIASIESKALHVIVSDHAKTRVICVLCFPKSNNPKEIDKKLLKSLLNQVHLLFLAIHSKHINN